MMQNPCIQFALTGIRATGGEACYVNATITDTWGYELGEEPTGDVVVFFEQDQFKYSVVTNQGIATHDGTQWNVLQCEMPQP